MLSLLRVSERAFQDNLRITRDSCRERWASAAGLREGERREPGLRRPWAASWGGVPHEGQTLLIDSNGFSNDSFV